MQFDIEPIFCQLIRSTTISWLQNLATNTLLNNSPTPLRFNCHQHHLDPPLRTDRDVTFDGDFDVRSLARSSLLPKESMHRCCVLVSASTSKRFFRLSL